MLARLGLVDRQAQARVRAEVAAALARGDHDFPDQAGPDLAALLVLAALAVLDVGPFAMSGHDALSDRRGSDTRIDGADLQFV